MPDINAVKLKRLVAHINDEGLLTPKAVAGVLGAKPENVSFLRDYVAAAAEDLKRPALVGEFDTAAGASILGNDTPPPAIIQSTPEPSIVASTEPPNYFYTDADGKTIQLVEIHRKGGNVVLGPIPEEPKNETVTVTLGGEPHTLDLTDLRQRPGGDMVEVGGKPYLAATLLVIAEAAK